MTENIKCPCCGSEDIRIDAYGHDFEYCEKCFCSWNEPDRQPPNAWIACSESEGLPEEGRTVIVCGDDGDVYTDWIIDDAGAWNFSDIVTHWQPRPQPPVTRKAGE